MASVTLPHPSVADAPEDVDIGSIENLLEQSREERLPSATRIRELAITAIANQFLDVPEVNLEMRAFLVQTTLPTVVLALERLLMEIERRNVQQPAETEADAGRHQSAGSRGGEAGTSAPAAELDTVDVQLDKPQEKFDAINWLAQHLFRNNPSYSNMYEQTSSAYIKSMKTVSDHLRTRIADLAAFREAKRLADELARKEELERERLARVARIEENRRIFVSLLGSVYKIWISSIWRKPPGQLYRQELIEEFSAVSKINEIQADAEVYRKTIRLITCLTTAQAAMVMDVPEDNLIFEASDPVYTLDPAQIERWDHDFFVKMLLKLMCMWTVNELSFFLRVLSSRLTSRGSILAGIYKEQLFIPKFTLPENAGVRDWLEELLPVVEVIKLDDPVHGDHVRKALKDFCLGKEDPRFQHQMDDETMPNPDDYVSVAETIYKSFSKSILGEFGPDMYKSLMTQLRKEIEEEQKLSEQRKDRAAASKSPSSTAAGASNAAAKRQAFARLLELVHELTDSDGKIQVPALVRLITGAMDKTEKDSDMSKFLATLRSHLGAVDKISPEQLMSKMESLVDGDIKVVMDIIGLLLSVHDELKIESVKEKEIEIARSSIEQRALDEIESLAERIDLTMSSACDVVIEIMSEAFHKLYPEHQVAGRVSLLETAITKLAAGQEKLSEDDSIEKSGVVESFLRTIATSQHLRRTLLGRTTSEGSGVDYQIMALCRELKIDNALTDPMTSEDPLVKESRPDTPHKIGFRFLGMPIMLSDNKALGTFDLLMKGTKNFEQVDVTFLERATGLLVTLLTMIDNRSKAIEIARAAKSYLSARCEATVDIHLVEQNQRNKKPEFYLLEEVRPSATPEVDMRAELRSVHASPYLRPWTARLTRIAPEQSPELADKLGKVFTNGKTINSPEGQTGCTYLPIVDSAGVCVAVAVLKVETGMASVGDRVKEIEKVGSLLGNVLSKVRKDKLGAHDSGADGRLETESIDENTRRKFFFGKILLNHVRELLFKIDAKALAELRSYKKPPKSVHRLIKGALYILARPPKKSRHGEMR
ncbi:hypothetical protein BC831DRAFT_6174 [Entophlyctis helioformis]|nr:hypothetical protein BC831DRAFT_6174 [Entophlyctis helioformis]